MSVDVWGELITTFVLNSFIAFLFGLANRKAYLASRRVKTIVRKLIFYITTFFFLFYWFALIVLVSNGLGFPEWSRVIVSFISIPLVIIIYRKLLVKWRKNEKIDKKN